MATGKRRSATSVILDTQKLHTLQTTSGFTQDEIAGRAGVSLRTVQRAFGGDRVRPYMAKQVARALGAELPDLISLVDDAVHDQTLEQVVAWKCDGGMRRCRALCGARIQSVRVNAEPLPETGDAIVGLIERLRELRPEPRWPHQSAEDACALRQLSAESLDHIRLAADLGGHIRTRAARCCRLRRHLHRPRNRRLPKLRNCRDLPRRGKARGPACGRGCDRRRCRRPAGGLRHRSVCS